MNPSIINTSKTGEKTEEEHPSLPNIKWIFNECAGIFHPVVEFETLTDKNKIKFPLKLKKIILGHKYAESLVNRVQIKSYLSSSPKFKDLGIEIEVSKNSFYR